MSFWINRVFNGTYAPLQAQAERFESYVRVCSTKLSGSENGSQEIQNIPNENLLELSGQLLANIKTLRKEKNPQKKREAVENIYVFTDAIKSNIEDLKKNFKGTGAYQPGAYQSLFELFTGELEKRERNLNSYKTNSVNQVLQIY